MKVIKKKTYEEISKLGAEMIAEVVKNKPNAVIGLATGSTPLGTYNELIRMHKEEGLDFSGMHIHGHESGLQELQIMLD